MASHAKEPQECSCTPLLKDTRVIQLGATRQNPVRDQNPLLQRPHFSNWRPSVVIKRSYSKWLFTILVLIFNGTLQLVFYHKLFTIIDWPAMVCSCDRICQRMRRKRDKILTSQRAQVLKVH